MSFPTRGAFSRSLLGVSLALTLAMPFAAARADAPVRLIVPYPPGGSVDTLARLLQTPLQDKLGSTVIVESRPGAGGRIAVSSMRREAADGTAVMIAPNALTTVQSLVYEGQLDYDVLRDLQPLSRLASVPLGVSVPATSDVKTVDDLKASFQANPAAANYGTSGAGGMAHFAGLLLGRTAGIEWTHVPFKGGAPLINDLIGNHVSVGIDSLVDHIEHQRAGKLRIIGIFSPQRYALAPDIPTMAEQGVTDMPTVEAWFGTYVPAGTPPATVDKLDRAIGEILSDPAMRDRLNRMLLEVNYLPSDEFSRLQAAELEQWAPVVKASGFKP
ncbi:MAG: tripartite tricarboxylate transporter substrate-binding protein [Pigmentiphaga sp.]|nr:tripartite tricarboxylate transporter substrate-binding protein [Pigmentiphaga sp.]